MGSWASSFTALVAHGQPFFCKNWYKTIILNYCMVCLDVSNLKETLIIFENYFFTSIQSEVQVQLCASLVHWFCILFELEETNKNNEV